MPATSVRRRIFSGSIAAAVVLAGVVIAPATAAYAAPTAWQCDDDTFQDRRGTTITNVDVATGLVTAGPTLTTSEDLNAIGFHPVTRIVYAISVTNPPRGEEPDPSVIARVINQDGTVEDVSSEVPLTGATASNYAGGTFTSEGYWLLANRAGNIATIDLTSPSSPTYGQAISTGFVLPDRTVWLSGDIAYREADDRVYFTTWTGDPSEPQADIRVGSISRADFVNGGDVTPTYGPVVTPPTALLANLGTSNGFDSNGNLWMTTSVAVEGEPGSFENVIWQLEGSSLQGADPIVPMVLDDVTPTLSGSDGFLCFGDEGDVQLPTIPLDPDVPTLAETGPSTGVVSALLAAFTALMAGLVLARAALPRRASTPARVPWRGRPRPPRHPCPPSSREGRHDRDPAARHRG